MRPICHILDTILLRYDTAFHEMAMQSVKSRRENVILSGVGEKVSRQLSRYKLVIGHVLAKGIYHPITPRPNPSFVIALVAIGI